MDDEEDIIAEDLPRVNTFSPKKLKIVIFGSLLLLLIFIIAIFAVIKVLDTRPKDAYYWYNNLDNIKFTSYEEPSFGTFFCSIKVNLAYQNEDVKEEIDAKKGQIVNIIRQTLSEQNYYRISNNMKLQYNLTPVLKRRINRILSKASGVKDISYPFIRLLLNTDNRQNSLSYLELGNFKISVDGTIYDAQLYIIYDSSSKLFNKYLYKHKPDINKIIFSYLSQEYINIAVPQTKIKKRLNSLLEDYFTTLEVDIKKENPYYEITGYFKNVFFGYFVPTSS